MGLLAHARCMVAADSGPLHLAAALGTPVVGLYGPTDPARNGPFVPERNDHSQGAARGDQLQAAIGIFSVHAANHGRRCAGGDRCGPEGFCLNSTPKTNFWIRWRVRVGYPVGIAAFVFARPQIKWLVCGVAIAVLGLVVRGYAAGHLRKHQKLATSGPYAFTRNPLYLGSVLLAAGFSVASHSWISASAAGRLSGGFLSGGDSQGTGGTREALRKRVSGICVASTGLLAAAHSGHAVIRKDFRGRSTCRIASTKHRSAWPWPWSSWG